MKGRVLLAFMLLFLWGLEEVQGLEAANPVGELSFETQPEVGTPSTVLIEVKDLATGRAIPNVQMALQILVPHARAMMFSGVFYSPDGELELRYNFQDADVHVFTLTVSPTDATPVEFEPFSKSYTVEVRPPEEPRGVWARTWAILMGVLITGIGAGYLATRRLQAA